MATKRQRLATAARAARGMQRDRDIAKARLEERAARRQRNANRAAADAARARAAR